MKKIKIAFDVDGVLLNFLQSTSDFIESHYGIQRNIPYSIAQYDLYERFKQEDIDAITFNKIKAEFEKHGHWKNLEPMPQIENVKMLFNNSNYDICFVTSIHVHLFEHRLHNLGVVLGQEINPSTLYCVALGESKKPFIDMIKPDFFIEDNLNNLVDCKGTHQSIWIDLKESYYDSKHLDNHPEIKVVTTLNDAVEYLQNNDYVKSKKVKP